MSRLDDLQTAAHQVSSDLDSPIGGLGKLQSDTDDAVQEALGIGIGTAAQVLDEPGKAALDDAMQAMQTAKEKLTEYVAAVEQAKGGG